MKKYLFAVMLLSLAVVAIPAHANYQCTGTVTYVAITPSGDIVVRMSGAGATPDIYICKLGAASSGNGWTADACKSAYATLLAAKLSGQSASIWFNDNLTCSTQPSFTPYVSTYFIEMGSWPN
jgi:hypothetical protein